MSSHSSNRDAAVDVSAGSSALPFWMAQLRGLTTWPSWRKDIPQLRMTVAEDCINSMDLLRCLTGKNTNRYIRKPSRGTFCFISELLPVGKSQPWSLGVASLSLRNAARVVTGRFPASWCRNGASIGMLRGFGWSVGFKRSGWGFDQFFLSTKKKLLCKPNGFDTQHLPLGASSMVFWWHTETWTKSFELGSWGFLLNLAKGLS